MRRLFHGWYVVACCFAMAVFGWGIGFYGLSVYLARLQDAHSWSNAEISAAITFYNLVLAATSAYVGDAFNKWGARQIVLTGSAALALGAAALGVVSQLWQVYVCFLGMALGYSLIGAPAINVIIARWFDAKRGLASSLAFSGATFGGILVSPVMIWMTAEWGFRSGLWAICLGLCLALWGIVISILRDGPRELGLEPDGLMARAPTAPRGEPRKLDRLALLRDRSFLTISVAFALGLTAQVAFLMHQVTFLSELAGTSAAASAVAITTISAVAGRIATGLFVDRVDRRLVAAANFLLQAASFLVLEQSRADWSTYLGCAVFGLSVGNMITLPGLIVQREFPPGHFGQVIGLVIAINQFVLAFGPALVGWLHDATGSYSLALLLCAGLDAGALLIIMLRPLADRSAVFSRTGRRG